MSQYNAKQLTIDSVIETKIVFEIPDYQRGYRWGKTEVTDLLDDIMDVVQEDKSAAEVRAICDSRPYCLQPIAFDVENESKGMMMVVDGQQRLTTLYLILRYIENRFSAIPPQFLPMFGIKDSSEYCRHYELKYDDPTREKIFSSVKNDLTVINTENIDSYYITQAYSVIEQWGQDRIGEDVNKLVVFAIKVFYGTSIIWYEIDQSTDGTSNDYFAKTNTGKIPLTNSELIKANLMLDEYCVERIDESKFQGATDIETQKNIANQKEIARLRLQNERIKMSRQWDEIESNLRNDEFWYFLTEASDEYEDTRIDYIFSIVAKKLYPYVSFSQLCYEDFMKSNKERGTFTIIARYLKENDAINPGETPIGLRVWKMAWDTFMVFKEWYENREWYHFVGYLISIEGGYDAKGLLELFSDNKYSSKIQIREALTNTIMDRVNLKEDDGIHVKSTTRYSTYLKSLNYDKTPKEIVDVLLLFNVISVLSDSVNGENNSRDTYFPFSRYKKEQWNKEHIHSKADGETFNKESATEFIKYLNEMFERMKLEKGKNPDKVAIEKALENYNSKINEQVANGIDEEEAMKFAAQDSAQLISESFGAELSDQMLNGIGNMALLDEQTNKSYKNAPFFMKRMIIGDIVRGKKTGVSRFIPLCTRNVFDKAYTVHPKNMLHWMDEDCEDYIDAISDTLCNYFSVIGGCK